jgi:hypothetical protein
MADVLTEIRTQYLVKWSLERFLPQQLKGFFFCLFTFIAYRILVGKPEGKRPLGRPRRRWVDNIKMDLREIGWDGMDWIDVAQDRDQWRALVNTVMNLWVP